MTDVKHLLKQANSGGQSAWNAAAALVNLRPTTPEEQRARAYGCACLAEGCFAHGKIGTAIDWWQEAIEGDPLNVLYYLGFVSRGLLPVGMFRQALNVTEQAIKLDASNPAAYRLLGSIQIALHDTAAAVAAFDRQLELAPDNPLSWLDRAEVALELADWETVEHCSHRLLATRERGNALHHLAVMAYRRGQHEEAIRLFAETLEDKCANPEIVMLNQSTPMLALGQYREGWKLHEMRSKQKRDPASAMQVHRGIPGRLWQNEPAPARLHVFQEQGFGDTLCLARYLPLLVARGYSVTYEVAEPLVALMQRSLPDVRVIPHVPLFPKLHGVPAFDYVVPDLSLPYLFATEVATIPWSGPYLKVDPQKVASYRQRLPDSVKVGLCWSPGIRLNHGLWTEEYGRRKSVPLDALESLRGDSHEFISLQVGSQRMKGPFLDLLPERPTWDDTAALIENLDLVISADTGVAHLAGALGKPLWLLMHTGGSWHWMTERLDSPWYPSARLFRAKSPHEWNGPVAAVSRELQTLQQLH